MHCIINKITYIDLFLVGLGLHFCYIKNNHVNKQIFGGVRTAFLLCRMNH